MKLYAKLLSVAGMVAAVAACDRQGPEDSHERTAANTRSTTQPATPAAPATEVAPKDEAAKVPNADTEDAKDASELVKDATQTLRKMKADQGVKTLLSKAKGVFIVPDYGRGAVGVGIRGGEGALLGKEADQWNGPLFYDIGGISVGAQFGGEGGEIAMLLMSDQALRAFKADNTFSLNSKRQAHGRGLLCPVGSVAGQGRGRRGLLVGHRRSVRGRCLERYRHLLGRRGEPSILR